MNTEIPQILAQNSETVNRINEYQEAPGEETLFRLLTEIAKCAMHGGMWMTAVNPAKGSSQLYFKIHTDDGKNWYPVFTDVYEGSHDESMTIINVSITDMLDTVITDEQADGIIVNMWNQSLPLDTRLLKVIRRTVSE